MEPRTFREAALAPEESQLCTGDDFRGEVPHGAKYPNGGRKTGIFGCYQTCAKVSASQMPFPGEPLAHSRRQTGRAGRKGAGMQEGAKASPERWARPCWRRLCIRREGTPRRGVSPRLNLVCVRKPREEPRYCITQVTTRWNTRQLLTLGTSKSSFKRQI